MNYNEEANRFWGEVYRQSYHKFVPKEYNRLLRQFICLLWNRGHLTAVEIPQGELTGKRILDLGCGAGAHTAFMRYYGGKVVAMDLSMVRARAAGGAAVVADMRHLPFRDGAFDIVHSNGVIHHAPDEARTVSEVHRVLRPGGLAAVMIYARNSFLYRAVLFPVRGILMGGIFRRDNWLGRATEWLPQTKQEVYNPYTSVFSEKESRTLFRSFGNVRIRKNSFVFDQIPLIGKRLGRLAGRWTGYNDGGILAYGRPWRNETALELWLGRHVGFCLNIRGTK